MSNFTSRENELNPIGRGKNQSPTGRPVQLNPFARASSGSVVASALLNARITEEVVIRITEDGDIRIID